MTKMILTILKTKSQHMAFIQRENQIGAQRNVLKNIFYSNENDYLFLQDVKQT